MEKVYFAILNITSYAGQCADATHVYGKLILCEKDIPMSELPEWNVNHLGKTIDIAQPLTLEISKKLDAKGGGKTYQRAFALYGEVDINGVPFELRTVNRFDTFEEVENFAIAKWKELNLDCPFVSLYEGELYDFKDRLTGEQCKTKIYYTIKD